MEIKRVTLSDLHPYPNNPRKNDKAIDAVAESIKQCGYCSPIVVDDDYMILAGHTRYKAMQKLGWDECEVCVVSGLSDMQKKAYVVADNKTSEIADWDIDKLSEFVQDLSDSVDLIDLGFNEAELLEIQYDLSPEQDDEILDIYTNKAECMKHKRIVISYDTDDEIKWLENRIGVSKKRILYSASDLIKQSGGDSCVSS